MTEQQQKTNEGGPSVAAGVMPHSVTPHKHTIQSIIDDLTAESTIRSDAINGRCPDAMADAVQHLRKAKSALKRSERSAA
jgi:hypothetical protein